MGPRQPWSFPLTGQASQLMANDHARSRQSSDSIQRRRFCRGLRVGAGGTASRDSEDLAGVNQVDILEMRICLGDASPGLTAAKLDAGDFPQRIALARAT